MMLACMQKIDLQTFCGATTVCRHGAMSTPLPLPGCRYECLPDGASAWAEWHSLMVLIEGPTEPTVMDAFLQPLTADIVWLAPPQPPGTQHVLNVDVELHGLICTAQSSS
jgi:hypothetical protein